MAQDLDPELTEPELSNRVLSAVVHELDVELGRQVTDALLDEAGLPRAYLEDTAGWVSMAFVGKLADAVARDVHQLRAAPPYDHPMWQTWRRAGQRSLHQDVIGPIFRVLRAFGSPGRFYERVPVLSARATRIARFEIKRHERGRVVLVSTPIAGRSLAPANCWFARGLYEAIPTVWGKPEAEVQHHECMHDPHHPAPQCVYRIRFHDRRTALVASGLLWALAGGAAGVVTSAVLGEPAMAPLHGLLGASVASAIDGWRRYARARVRLRREAQELDSLLNEADARQRVMWEEQVALRRSVLAAKKLSDYLASDLVEQILEHPELELKLGGSETTAAVLFADIVGFTPRCERLSPSEVVDQLNIYFGHVDRAFDKHRGVIDKRMGDGIMAVFIPRTETLASVAVRAVRCALDILDNLEDCNRDLAARGAEPFQIRIGVATGMLVQGSMGSDVRLEYTVIGDVVNLAARLQGQAAPGHVLTPHTMLEALGEEERAALVMGERRTLTVKGRTEPVDAQDVRPRRAP